MFPSNLGIIEPIKSVQQTSSHTSNSSSIDETIQLIEKLSKLKGARTISENEYNTKKPNHLTEFNHRKTVTLLKKPMLSV
jgi:hypothetical protein